MIYTTLNRIREHEPCVAGWRKLLKGIGKTDPDDAPLAYSTILESNGLDDALWCLRAEPQHASIWRMYAVRCARRVQHLLTDERSLQALDVAERHARGGGLAADAELAAAWDAARNATRVPARNATQVAARDAAWVAAKVAAGVAAGIAARDAAKDAAWVATWVATRDAARAEQNAMPGESCALVDWWSLETTLAASHLPVGWCIEAHEEAAEALKKEREAHAETNRAMTDELLMMEEREQRDEALLRQALEGIELHLRHHERGCVFLDEIALALRERLGEGEQQ